MVQRMVLLALIWSTSSVSFRFPFSNGGRLSTSRSQSLHQLGFMIAAVTDSALEDVATKDVNVVGEGKPVDYHIKEAAFNDLPSIVSLRVNVFYPELKTIASFHSRILDKMRLRRGEGSICLVATKNPTEEQILMRSRSSQMSYVGGLSNSLLGAVEFSPGDFKGTPMEWIGADRKLYVADLAVRADARRMGIATQLLQAIELYAVQNNYEEIYLHVEVDNSVGRNLYYKFGYEEVPRYDWAVVFTQRRLHKSVHNYILLLKSLGGEANIKVDSCSSAASISLLDNRSSAQMDSTNGIVAHESEILSMDIHGQLR